MWSWWCHTASLWKKGFNSVLNSFDYGRAKEFDDENVSTFATLEETKVFLKQLLGDGCVRCKGSVEAAEEDEVSEGRLQERLLDDHLQFIVEIGPK